MFFDFRFSILTVLAEKWLYKIHSKKWFSTCDVKNKQFYKSMQKWAQMWKNYLKSSSDFKRYGILKITNVSKNSNKKAGNSEIKAQ